MSNASGHTARKYGPLPELPLEVNYEHSKANLIQDEAAHSERRQPEHYDGHQTSPSKDVSDFGEAFASVNDQLRETKIKLNEAVEALASLHSSDGFRESDDRIAMSMKELRHDIRQWSRNFQNQLKKPGVAKTLRLKILQDDQCLFKAVTYNWQHYLASEDDKDISLLVQAYVWKQLLDEVFGRSLWLGGPCKFAPGTVTATAKPCQMLECFKVLQVCCEGKKNTSTYNHYYQWRAQTVRLLIGSSRVKAHKPCIDHNIKSITKVISSKLKDYAEKKDIFTDNNSNRGLDNLASIVRSAMALDLVLWKQKACFYFHTWYPQYSQVGARNSPEYFQAAWMTSDMGDRHDDLLMTGNGGGPHIVQLIVTPALIKCGTSEGDKYDQEVVLCKAVVDCRVGFK